MKNQIFLVAVFCLISSIVCSMDSNPRTVDVDVTKLELDLASKTILINSGRAANIARNYWATDVEVALGAFYLCKDQYANTDNPRYAVSLIGRIKRGDMVNGRFELQTIRRDTTGAYRKNELDALGVNLPQVLAESFTANRIRMENATRREGAQEALDNYEASEKEAQK